MKDALGAEYVLPLAESLSRIYIEIGFDDSKGSAKVRSFNENGIPSVAEMKPSEAAYLFENGSISSPSTKFFSKFAIYASERLKAEIDKLDFTEGESALESFMAKAIALSADLSAEIKARLNSFGNETTSLAKLSGSKSGHDYAVDPKELAKFVFCKAKWR